MTRTVGVKLAGLFGDLKGVIGSSPFSSLTPQIDELPDGTIDLKSASNMLVKLTDGVAKLDPSLAHSLISFPVLAENTESYSVMNSLVFGFCKTIREADKYRTIPSSL
ncbi:MAG: hypothetical protein KKC80_08835, partial [Candidatus Margulisbacteria bacterium]|nr:hypothetical protein [Candidatus Margulisiibacteriota bacterium]